MSAVDGETRSFVAADRTVGRCTSRPPDEDFSKSIQVRDGWTLAFEGPFVRPSADRIDRGLDEASAIDLK